MDKLDTMDIKKIITLLFVATYLVLVVYMMIRGIDKVPTEFVAFSGMVNLIIGTYFGHSMGKDTK